VVAAVAGDYGWQGAVTAGGSAAADADAPYDNGVVRGAFKWNWRAESGDWRFFFLDAAQPPPDSFWLMRSRWTDAKSGSDIDSRLWGPRADRFSDPAAPGNETEDWSDPGWYGPYTLAKVGQSEYLHRGGGTYAQRTTSGGNEDWVAAPAAGGLHELMLHNVLLSGSQIEMPFETLVSSIQIRPTRIQLFGDRCATVSLRSELDLPEFQVTGIGMASTETLADQPVQQDTQADVGTTTYRKDWDFTTVAVQVNITIAGEADDDLDLFLLRDGNGDGQFTYPDEVYATAGNGPSSQETLTLGTAPAGRYQIWVHGYTVLGTNSTFDLTRFAMTGDDLYAKDLPAAVTAGVPVTFQVCARLDNLAGQDGPAMGVLTLGPGAAPQLFQLPVTWWRALPTLHLPLTLMNADLGPTPAPETR
jgi:hypothetical protein